MIFFICCIISDIRREGTDAVVLWVGFFIYIALVGLSETFALIIGMTMFLILCASLMSDIFRVRYRPSISWQRNNAITGRNKRSPEIKPASFQPSEQEKNTENTTEQNDIWLNQYWKTSGQGNVCHLNTNGYRIVLYQLDDIHGWTGFIKNIRTGRKHRSKNIYPTLEKAKLAARDGMNYMEKHP